MINICTCPNQTGTNVNKTLEDGKRTCFVCNKEVRLKDLVIFADDFKEQTAMSEQDLKDIHDKLSDAIIKRANSIDIFGEATGGTLKGIHSFIPNNPIEFIKAEDMEGFNLSSTGEQSRPII